jgi:molybdenum cofactor synthesis domain-containing protein
VGYTAGVPTAGIILIGDEILSGKVADENAAFLVGELRALGVAVRRIVVIPDVIDEITETVRALAGRFDHVFTSGGVGPTHDDLTMAGVARAFDTVVVRHPQLEGMLRAYFGERLEERNLRMAEVPEGAVLVPGDGPGSVWPVVSIENVYILPGVPEIFRRKFSSIRERFRAAPYHLRCVFTSADEGSIAGDLDRVVAAFSAVQVGSYPKLDPTDYRVKVTLESKDAEAVEAATRVLCEALGDRVVRVS